jgi:hypothetical protein
MMMMMMIMGLDGVIEKNNITGDGKLLGSG